MRDSPWQGWAEVGEGEHRQGDEGVGAVEAEGAAGDQPDLGVDRLDTRVGEAVLDCGQDPGALLGDGAGELDERRQAASARPLDPAVQERDGRISGEPVDLPELFLEQVGAIEPAVGGLDVGELGALAGGEVLGVLPQRKPRALQIAGGLGLPGAARLVSDRD